MHNSVAPARIHWRPKNTADANIQNIENGICGNGPQEKTKNGQIQTCLKTEMRSFQKLLEEKNAFSDH